MPEIQNRTDLFFETGWMLATPEAYPALKELETVQRFRSRDGNWIFDVFVDSLGLQCGCPGWTKRQTCWHVRWVLRWNIDHGELGRFVTRLPGADEFSSGRVGVSPAQWFDHHVAVVPPELATLADPPVQTRRRRPASLPLPPSIRSQ
jgi:hypothetical protein